AGDVQLDVEVVMVGVDARVLAILGAAAVAAPGGAVPDDELDADLIGVLDEPVGDGITEVIVGLAAVQRDEDVDGAARAVDRHAGAAGDGAAVVALVVARAGE